MQKLNALDATQYSDDLIIQERDMLMQALIDAMPVLSDSHYVNGRRNDQNIAIHRQALQVIESVKANKTAETVLTKASIMGVIEYMRSKADDQVCVCCPPNTGHVFSRNVNFEKFNSVLPDHFGYGVREFLYTTALSKNAFEGKRVRVTVEVLEGDEE